MYKKFNPNNTGKKITKLSRGLFLNIGITYNYFTPINLTNEISIYTETSNYGLVKDSLISTATEKVSFPQGIRVGLSIEKPMVWTIAADASYYPWSVYRPSNAFMRSDIYTAALGLELTPNGNKSNRAKTYRIGANYSQMPYIMNGKQLADWSISAGMTIPFGKRPAYWFPVLPKLTMSLIAGHRSTNAEGQIHELYIKIFFSLLISEKWFTISKFH